MPAFLSLSCPSGMRDKGNGKFGAWNTWKEFLGWNWMDRDRIPVLCTYFSGMSSGLYVALLN